MSNRAAFLSFFDAIVGKEVETKLIEGPSIKGMHHTATPFAGKDFVVCIKASRPEVCGQVILSVSVSRFLILSPFQTHLRKLLNNRVIWTWRVLVPQL